MNQKFNAALAACILSLGSAAIAVPAVEGFESFSGVMDGDGSSAAGQALTNSSGFDGASSASDLPFTDSFGDVYAGTGIVIDTTDPFEGAQSLTWAANSDAFALIGGPSYATVLPGTDGTVYAAFAVRVNSLAAAAADVDIELLRLGQGTGERDIHIGVLDGSLDLVARNGGAGTTLSADAFNPASGSNWDDDTWRVLAIEAIFDTVGTGSSVTVWEVTAGGNTQLGQDTGFTATRADGITHYGYGAFAIIPTGTADTSISVDQVTIYDRNDIADQATFLTTVAADLLGIASVDSWDLY